jgi:hypothetical protein
MNDESKRGDAGSADDGYSDPLLRVLEQFEATIDGLIELLDVISPHVAALDRPEAMTHAIDQAGFSPAGNSLAKALFTGGAVAVEAPMYETPEDGNGSPSARVQPEGGIPEEEVAPPVPEEVTAIGDAPEGTVSAEDAQPVIEEALNALVKDEPEALLRIFRRAARSSLVPREGLLNGSLLTVAVAAFETLLAGVYREHLIRHPNQLDSQEKEFSLADLLEYGSVEEARRVLIERRADAFMRRSLADWSAWSGRTLGQNFSALSLDLRVTTEIFQRRHLIVHAGGVVNQTYLDRVDFGDTDPPALGDELAVEGTYLRHALDEVYVLGVAVASVALAKWNANEGPKLAAGRIISCSYDLMQEDRWPLVRTLCQVGGTLGQDDARKWVVRVNGWLAARALNDDGSHETEIANWDVSALDVKFKLAKAALQGEAEVVVELLPGAMESAGDEAAIVPSWPLLAPFRAHPEFRQAVLNSGFMPPDLPAETAEPNEGEVGLSDESPGTAMKPK